MVAKWAVLEIDKLNIVHSKFILGAEDHYEFAS
jgi:hypothetical protein